MRILSVRLVNVKSHRDSEIIFSPGINVLAGPNGAGKSTVFEAIGYALFGVNAQDFVTRAERFLSIGAKKGEISVDFMPSDGKRYRAIRSVGGAGKWLLAREEGGVFEVEEHAGAQETEARIAELLGLDNGRPLADQFKLVIGPFQNDFLGPFVIRQPSRRMEAFDEILGIDTWRTTYKDTLDLLKTISARIATIEADISAREEQLAALPEREEELKALLGEESAKQAELSGVRESLAQVTALLSDLEGKKETIEKSAADLKQIEGRIANGREKIAAQEGLVERSTTAAAAVEESRAGKEHYDTAETLLTRLREEEKQRREVERLFAEAEAARTRLAQAAEHEEREAVEQARTLAEEELRLDAEAKELAARLEALRQESTEWTEACASLSRLKEEFFALPLCAVETLAVPVRGLLERLSALEAEIGGLERELAVEEEWNRAAAPLRELRAELERLREERGRLEGRKAGLAEGDEKLTAGTCPFFGEGCRNLEGKDAREFFSLELRMLEEESARLEEAVSALNPRIAACEAAGKELERLRTVRATLSRLDLDKKALQADLAEHLRLLDPDGARATLSAWLEKADMPEVSGWETRLPLLSKGDGEALLSFLERFESECAGLKGQISAILESRCRAAEENLAASREALAVAEAKGKELERRRREIAAKGDLIANRRAKATELAGKAATAGAEVESLAARLALFSGLEERIVRAEEEKRAFQGENERYLKNLAAAQELENHRATLQRFRDLLAQLEEEQKTKETLLEELKRGYDAEAHEGARREKEKLAAQEATLCETLRNINANRIRLERDIVILKAILEEIAAKRQECERLTGKEKVVKFLRDKVFRQVSTRLSERFREEIGLVADRIYRSISPTDEELCWGENYQVVLRDLDEEGRVRERSDDQLSGGQMMSAVVALRLALLQTVGARIAFFDEPTSNLDAARRENLASAFRSIDIGREEVTEHWYDQLFLISHDVAFADITDQVVEL